MIATMDGHQILNVEPSIRIRTFRLTLRNPGKLSQLYGGKLASIDQRLPHKEVECT
jgi:hypothetical protein